MIGAKPAMMAVIELPEYPRVASQIPAPMLPAPRRKEKIVPAMVEKLIAKEIRFFVKTSELLCSSAILAIRSGKSDFTSPYWAISSGGGRGPENDCAHAIMRPICSFGRLFSMSAGINSRTSSGIFGRACLCLFWSLFDGVFGILRAGFYVCVGFANAVAG